MQKINAHLKNLTKNSADLVGLEKCVFIIENLMVKKKKDYRYEHGTPLPFCFLLGLAEML